MLQLRNANNKKNLPKNTSLEDLVSSIPSRTFLQEYFRIMRKSKLASTALQAGKTAEKDIEMKAIYMGKTVAIDAG